MGEFTNEEEKALVEFFSPRYAKLKTLLDEIAVNAGYESHVDYLVKEGWLKSVCEYQFPRVRNLFKSVEDE